MEGKSRIKMTEGKFRIRVFVEIEVDSEEEVIYNSIKDALQDTNEEPKSVIAYMSTLSGNTVFVVESVEN